MFNSVFCFICIEILSIDVYDTITGPKKTSNE